MKTLTKVVVYEHPTYGEARVGFSWKRIEGFDEWVWRVEFVEFDFFTPPEEQEALMDALALGREVHGVAGAPESTD